MTRTRPAIGGCPVRADAYLKVTGRALYPADVAVANAAHAYCLTSSVARGRIVRIDTSRARAQPGILAVHTHLTMRGRLAPTDFAATSAQALQTDRIWHQGQIVAIAVADSYENAREAARAIVVEYQESTAAAVFDSAHAERVAYGELDKSAVQARVGDVAAALNAAAVTIDATYETSPQHHNAMELHTTTCVWTGDQLIIHEPTNWVYAILMGVVQQLGLERSKVVVVSPFVGGSFGGKGTLAAPTSLIALIAKELQRPVKLVLTRQQIYSLVGNRAETRSRVQLGAESSGKLTAYRHQTWEVTSRCDVRSMNGTDNSVRLYGWSNAETLRHLVRLDRNTPGAMRAPPECPVMFALESALDEMAYALGMDPVQLRIINHTPVDPVSGKPFTSRSLVECYRRGAEAFGWSRRPSRPGAMRDGDWLIGWGCATAAYPSYVAPASARVRLSADGSVLVQVASHDMGTGTYTMLRQVAAEALGVEIARVAVELGDSRFPPAPYSGGSMTTAAVGSAVAQACAAIRTKLGGPDDVSRAAARMPTGAIEELVDWAPAGSRPGAIRESYSGKVAGLGGVGPDDLRFAFGAEFVEVRVHAQTREVRIPRLLGVFAAGRIINPRLARSQLMGGMVWGIGSALLERTELDIRTARYVNADLADYLIPVNADIGDIEVMFVPEVDTQVNPLGVKGLGELGNVGTDAAIANALFHATGRRVRELPIRIDRLITAE